MDDQVNVSKWNPFKFLRKTPDERRSDSPRNDIMRMPSLPAEAAIPLPLLFADPFRLMQALVEPGSGMSRLDGWFGDFSPSVFRPRIDVVDDDDALRVTAELPGMQRDDLHINVEEGTLVLRGEKKLESKQDENGCYRVERAFGRFERVIPLPGGLDLDRAEATFDKGLLTIRIPKSIASTEENNSRELKIN